MLTQTVHLQLKYEKLYALLTSSNLFHLGDKTLITKIDLGSEGAVNCSIKNFSAEHPWAGMVTCHLDMEYNIPDDLADGEK